MVQRIEASMVANQMGSGSLDNVARASGVKESSPQVETEQKSAVSIEQLKDAVAKLNEFMDKSERGLSFTMDETLNRPIVSVIDKASGEVIRKIPSDEVIAAVKNMEALRGILFDKMG